MPDVEPPEVEPPDVEPPDMDPPDVLPEDEPRDEVPLMPDSPEFEDRPIELEPEPVAPVEPVELPDDVPERPPELCDVLPSM